MRSVGSRLILCLVLVSGISLLTWRWYGSPSVVAIDTVYGEVRDDRDPIPAATVRYQGTRASTVTDDQGRFRLPARFAGSGRLTVAKAGYFIGAARAGSGALAIQLRRLPAVDYESYRWISPHPDAGSSQNCGNCHVGIYKEWSGSGHARSVDNRHFLNLYDGSDWHGRRKAGWSLLADNPDGAGVCTSCHAPSLAFDDPAYYDLRQATGSAAKGVHCDYCHKVADVEDVQFGLTHGRFGLKLLRPEKGRLFLGPLDDVERGEDSYAPIYRDSRYCASCHEGVVFGVHVYGTYSEWLDSPARKQGKQCQTCHMAPTGNMTNFAPGHGGIPRDPQTLGNHVFFAGNHRTMLQQCLKTAVRGNLENQTTFVSVAITPGDVGHRVPTGFVDRNLALVVEAFSKEGKPLQAIRETPLLPIVAGKAFRNLPGVLYAKQLSDFDGNSPVPFWRARPELIDTRLVPGTTARTAYRFSGSAAHVRVRIIHRRFWQTVADEKSWPDNELIVIDKTLPVLPSQVTEWSGP